jgi:hypothetical protein
MKNTELVTVALVIQHAKRMRRMTLGAVACLTLPFCWALADERQDKRRGKKLLNIKYVLIFSEIWSGIFLMLRRISREIIIYTHRSSCKVHVILVRFNRT